MTGVERPLDEMVLNPIQKSKYFSREADIVLLCLTHEHGYGKWTEIKHALRRDPRVRFDHLVMSRSVQELQKRVDILVKSIEKELEQEAKQQKKRANGCGDSDTEMVQANGDDSDVEMRQVSEDEGDSDSEAQIRIGNDCHSDTDG